MWLLVRPGNRQTIYVFSRVFCRTLDRWMGWRIEVEHRERRAEHPPCGLIPDHPALPDRATLGTTQVEVPDAGGASIVVESRSVTIPAEDLAGYKPRNGDRLTGEGIDHEVAAPAAGTPSWAWVDSYQTRMRVYLKEHHGS